MTILMRRRREFILRFGRLFNKQRKDRGLTTLSLKVGLAGAFALTRVLRNHLDEVGPMDTPRQ